jgi:hypothetical protein
MKGQTRRITSLYLYTTVLSMLSLFAGCGGGTGGGGGGTRSTTITVDISEFFPPPLPPMALKVGTGPFTPITPQSNQQITFTVPSATVPYALAWECTFIIPPSPGNPIQTIENIVFVFESTAQDATSYRADCSGANDSFHPFPPKGSATGTVDASAIPGAHTIEITGAGGGDANGDPLFVLDTGGSVPFNATLTVGTDDVAFAVFNSSSNIGGIKILRGQTVPGAINGGNTVIFGPSDVPTTQPLNVNIPAGFSLNFITEDYFTAGPNSTSLLLDSSLTQYQAVPTASAQNGDSYLFTVQASNATSSLGLSQSITNGGGPLTLALPAPWSYAGPTPAALPTFDLNYSGVAGLPTVTQTVDIGWQTSANPLVLFEITVLATGSYQNGATTITIPDLSGIPGFFGPASSGTTVPWAGVIRGGSLPLKNFLPSLPHTDSSSVFVLNTGSYVVP